MTQTMMIIIAVSLQLISALAAYQYLTHRVDGKLSAKEFFRVKFQWQYLAVMSSAFAISVFVLVKNLVWDQEPFIRALMNAQVVIGLFLMGYIDFRERIIPNGLIGIGLIFWAVLLLIDIFVAKTSWKSALTFSAIGAVGVGGLLFVIALFAKNALGMGDVKLFFLLGLLYGLADAYAILLFSEIIMALVSLVLLATKKVAVKTAIPMAPFVVLGFILCIVAGM